jgi:hypothetical protein
LSQVTRAVLERALAEEMTSHLGYEKHDLAGRGTLPGDMADFAEQVSDDQAGVRAGAHLPLSARSPGYRRAADGRGSIRTRCNQRIWRA